MSRLQSAFCRSAPWRFVAGRTVLPWALHGFEPHGEVLEIGGGTGAMAAGLLERHPDVVMTMTDVDDGMLEAARARLASFGPRATVRHADATALPFADGSFDAVVTFVMLHHAIEWERALDECLRVLQPGGDLVGFDLLASPLLRGIHRGDNHSVRPMDLGELREAVARLPVDDATLRPSLAGHLVRFHLRKSINRP